MTTLNEQNAKKAARAAQEDFKTFVLDQLEAIPDVVAKRMFGGRR